MFKKCIFLVVIGWLQGSDGSQPVMTLSKLHGYLQIHCNQKNIDTGYKNVLEKIIHDKEHPRFFKDEKGFSLLHWSVLKQDTYIARLLLENDFVSIRIRSDNEYKYTPLQSALSCELLNIIPILLQHNADIAERAVNGDTVLHVAARNNDIELMKIIVDKIPLHKNFRQLLHQKNNKGDSPCSFIQASNNIQLQELVCERLFQEMAVNN